jgi:hypothetical protein
MPENATLITVADKTYLDKWKFCIESQDAYAEKYGYKRLLISKESGSLNFYWTKLPHAIDALRAGDLVLVLDADVEVKNSAPDFREVFDSPSTAHIALANGASGRPNSGVMMFKGKVAIDFLSRVLESRLQKPNRENVVSSKGENGHIIQTLKKYEKYYQELGIEWNCSIPEKINDAYFLHYTNHLKQHFNF